MAAAHASSTRRPAVSRGALRSAPASSAASTATRWPATSRRRVTRPRPAATRRCGRCAWSSVSIWRGRSPSSGCAPACPAIGCVSACVLPLAARRGARLGVAAALADARDNRARDVGRRRPSCSSAVVALMVIVATIVFNLWAHRLASALAAGSPPMLQARGLTKRYGGLLALDRVSFDLHPGEIVGYLGPNGSGKSTTVNLVVGLLEPTAGELSLSGIRAVRRSDRLQAADRLRARGADLYAAPHRGGVPDARRPAAASAAADARRRGSRLLGCSSCTTAATSR